MIRVQGLAKYFGRFSALRRLELEVLPGQFVVLFGRNGAGKTTFLKILAGLTRPSAGSVEVRSPEPRPPQAARGLIGYLSHNTALYMDLTALENLRFYAHLMGLPGGEEELLRRIQRVGLGGREHEPVRNYSRGMQQRLAIARAFLHDPAILLLDEPFTGLDQGGTSFLREYLSAAHHGGKTCLMAIHDVALGYELADRLVVIEKGVVAADLPRSYVSLEDFQRHYRDIAREH
jgi:heme exporter protein A